MRVRACVMHDPMFVIGSVFVKGSLCHVSWGSCTRTHPHTHTHTHTHNYACAQELDGASMDEMLARAMADLPSQRTEEELRVMRRCEPRRRTLGARRGAARGEGAGV